MSVCEWQGMVVEAVPSLYSGREFHRMANVQMSVGRFNVEFFHETYKTHLILKIKVIVSFQFL